MTKEKFYSRVFGMDRYERLLNEEKSILLFMNDFDLFKYDRLYSEQIMFENEHLITEEIDAGTQEQAIRDIQNRNFIKDDYDSYLSQYGTGKKMANLTLMDKAYMVGHKFHTCQVPNISAGFFIGDDGYAGGLYNNSGIPDIGKKLIEVMMDMGTYTDHLDGKLSCLYDGYNIPVTGHDIWDDSQKPDDWHYSSLDASNIHFFYGKQIQKYKDNMEDMPEELKNAIKRYSEGKPDIIFRGNGTDIR